MAIGFTGSDGGINNNYSPLNRIEIEYIKNYYVSSKKDFFDKKNPKRKIRKICGG